jgi:hypothetical protein
MSVLADAGLLDRVIFPAWYLEITGFPYRFYSHASDPPPASADHTDVLAVQAVSRGGSSLEADQGRVRQKPITVTLDRTTYWDVGAAAQALQRLRPEGARRRLLLLTSVTSAGVADIEVQTDNSGWDAAGIIYLEAEAIEYTGLAGTGGPGDPWRFTGITRGALDTMPASHLVDGAQGLECWVLSDVVAWRTRPAKLYLRNSGATGWAEWLVGFVEGSPRSAAEGIELRLVPWDAILDVELGGAHLDCGLAHAWRVMTVGHRDQIEMAQIWEVGQAVNVQSGAFAPVAAGAIVANTGPYADVFDITLAATDPRHPSLKVQQAPNVADFNPTAIPAADTFTAPGSPAPNVLHGPGGGAGLADSVPIVNARTALTALATIDPSAIGTEVTLRWPLDYLSAINAVWAPGTNKGATGLWADGLIIEREQRADGPRLSLKLNSTKHAGKLICRWVSGAILGRSLDYPIRLAPDDSTTWRNGTVEWEHDEQLGQESGSANGRRLVEIYIADAFFQRGEPAITVDSAKTAVGVESWWVVTWDERGEEREETFRGKITGTVTAGGQTVGYRLEVTSGLQDTPSFGDWPGFGRCRIRPACVWKRADLRRVIVEMLTSVEGAGVNGAYDTQPYGLGVPASAVDAVQILDYPLPPALAVVDITIAEPRKAAEILAPLLVAAGVALQPHLDPETGLRRIRLAQMTRASVVESVATLAVGDWTVDPEVTGTDDKVTNSWTLKVRDSAGVDRLTRWSDRDSARAHGEVRGAELDLREVHLPLADEAASAAAALRSVFGQLRASMAWPRRTAGGAVDQSALLHLDACDVVTVSADELVGYDGAEGVAGIPLRLADIEHDVEQGTSQIEGVLDGLAGTGWAPSLYVEAVIGPTIVRVAANRYTDTEGPTGAARADLDFWTTGPATLCPAAGWTGATGTITVINTGTRQVTFAAAHGLLAGDSIDPVVYDSAAAMQRLYAFLADAALGLGAGPAAAKTWS